MKALSTFSATPSFSGAYRRMNDRWVDMSRNNTPVTPERIADEFLAKGGQCYVADAGSGVIESDPGFDSRLREEPLVITGDDDLEEDGKFLELRGSTAVERLTRWLQPEAGFEWANLTPVEWADSRFQDIREALLPRSSG